MNPFGTPRVRRLSSWMLGVTLGATLIRASAAESSALRFDFGAGPAAFGFTAVRADMAFTSERGFGFDAGTTPEEFAGDGSDALRTDGVGGPKPFFFSTAVPAEGNYRVTVTLGRPDAESSTTIKAELRRLMVEHVRAAKGEFATRTFIFNTRTHHIVARNGIEAGIVKLKAPRETTQEAWAWDNLLTLEFNGPAPAVCALEIEPVNVPTVFLIGDSTVCDQSREPYNSWGQMLPRFFNSDIAIANHAESGETYRDSIGRRRLDKIISVMRPGDWLFMQFGHNDQKQIAAGTGGPFTTYEEEMRTHIAAVRKVGGIPVVVSPMERRNFDEAGHLMPSLADYAKASREVAEKEGVAFIDLNAMSKTLYEAMGVEHSAAAFAAPEGKQDASHHTNYGSYELARCVTHGIRAANLPLAKYLVTDVPDFDPSHPDPIETFAVPPSPQVTNQRPLGD
jgi:lysophospholipase L1-like esterase